VVQTVKYDPNLSYFGHPQLPAGFNADPIDGDEVDGAGNNWPVWPVLVDTFELRRPLILTDESFEVFEGCADLVIGCVNNTITLPRDVRTLTIRRRAA
jgi:hypothetical protein